MEVALGAVGAGIGSIFPGGAMLGWAIGTTVGGAVTALTQRAEDQQVGRLDDLKITVSSNAAAIPTLWGTMRLGGNVIWATNLTETSSSSGGGKGKPRITRFKYSISCAVLICAGPVNRVVRIWAEDRIIYDVTQTPATRETIRVYTGTETQVADTLIESALGVGNVPGYRGRCYVVFENLDLTPYGNRLPNFSFEVEQSTSATLSSVVSDVAGAVGLLSTDLEVSAGTDGVSGYVLNSRSQAKSVLEPLLRVYATDMIEADGKLRLVKRGGAAVATVLEEELGAIAGNTAGARYEIKRTPEIELSTRLDLVYLSAGKQYQQQVQGAIRHSKPHLQDVTTVTFPGTLSDDLARQIAERELYLLWRERESFKLLLPPKYEYTTPGDVLNVPVAGVVRRLRIEQLDIAALGEVAMHCVLDDDTVLLQVAAGASQTAASPALLAPIPTTFLAFSAKTAGGAIELRDEEATSAGFYVSAGGGAGWNGATIYWSPDGGTTWIVGGTVSENSAVGATVAGASGVLANYTGTGFDAMNTVQVTLTNGKLYPATTTEINYGINRALLGDEVIAIASPSLVSGTTYQLSTFLRKLRGTVGTGHAAGDRFAMVDAAVRVVVADSLQGSSVKVRVVSPYQSVTDAAVAAREQTITIGTKSGAPWATPADVAAVTTSVTVEELDGSPSFTTNKLQFDQGDGFSVTNNSGAAKIKYTPPGGAGGWSGNWPTRTNTGATETLTSSDTVLIFTGVYDPYYANLPAPSTVPNGKVFVICNNSYFGAGIVRWLNGGGTYTQVAYLFPGEGVMVIGNGFDYALAVKLSDLQLGAKGDLATYGNAPIRLPVGSDGQILTADSTQGVGLKWATPSGGGAVSSVAAADSTLTVTPTTGAVTAKINLANANTWSGNQKFTGSSFEIQPGGAGTRVTYDNTYGLDMAYGATSGGRGINMKGGTLSGLSSFFAGQGGTIGFSGALAGPSFIDFAFGSFWGNPASAIGMKGGFIGDVDRFVFAGQSSTSTARNRGYLRSEFAISTDASYTGRLRLTAQDFAGEREGLRLEADGTNPRIGFLGSSAIAKPAITGDRKGNAALASILTQLANYGLITNSTTDSGAGAVPTSCLLSYPASTQSLVVADTELAGSRAICDLTNVQSVRLSVGINSIAGGATLNVRVQSSPDGVTWSNLGGSVNTSAVPPKGVLTTTWSTISLSGDYYLRLVANVTSAGSVGLGTIQLQGKA